MDDYLSKPVRMKELQAVLAQAIDPDRTQSADPSPTVDVTVLDALLHQLGDAGEETRGELIQQYQEDSSDLLARAREALTSHDFAAMASVGHTWSSSSTLLGMTRLGELLRALETSARAEQPSCGAQLESAAAEYRRVNEVLAGAKTPT